MNPARLRLLPALVAFALCAAPVETALAASDQPTVNVNALAEVEALARGYQSAFDAIPNSPVYITYERKDKGFTTLSGIRSVKAAGGVLIIRTDRGPTLVVPATAIVVMTDERP